jgi:flagellar biosynthesis GTPase FlhF
MTSSAEADIEPDSQILKTQDSSGQMSLMQGVFSQASAIVQKAIGGGKKNKPGVLGVKSIQLASVAAKKVVFAYHVDQSSMLMQELQQQEEADKKAIRMKEMENRRKLAAQRKQEEERAREAEIDKKNREEAERRRKEREEDFKKSKMPQPKKVCPFLIPLIKRHIDLSIGAAF